MWKILPPFNVKIFYLFEKVGQDQHPWTADPFHQLGGFENAFTTFQRVRNNEDPYKHPDRRRFERRMQQAATVEEQNQILHQFGRQDIPYYNDTQEGKVSNKMIEYLVAGYRFLDMATLLSMSTHTPYAMFQEDQRRKTQLRLIWNSNVVCLTSRNWWWIIL